MHTTASANHCSHSPLKGNYSRLTETPTHQRDADFKVVLYTFNNNGLNEEQIAEVERELDVEIRTLELPRWYRWLFKFHLLFLRVFLKYPFVNYIKLPQRYVDEIKAQHPDLIWVNSEEMSRIPKQFPGFRRIQIGPDVESLYYYRMMGRRFVMNKFIDYWKCAIMYRKYAQMEQAFCNDESFTYLAVGEADIEHLRQLAPNVNCKFLRHPHYAVSERGPIKFHEPKIRLLLAGQYNLYMQQTADEALAYMVNMPQEQAKSLQEHYVITFLGKGWERHVTTLRNIGFDVEHITFAPSYLKEIIRHDIQVTPITIGTGTKGKVLDALANGLLVLGTPYAMENIAVEHGKSCVVWCSPAQLIGTLLDIPNNIADYEQMAEAGRQAILQEHNPQMIAKQLFSCSRLE